MSVGFSGEIGCGGGLGDTPRFTCFQIFFMCAAGEKTDTVMITDSQQLTERL